MLPEGHPYRDLIDRVVKPGRYTGGEHQQVVKEPGAVACRLALAYPDVYEVGMSHLGLKILYSQVNRQDDLACERVFAPWPDLEAELRAAGVPLVTLETATPLGAMDVVGFSLQYELNHTNILAMLDLGGIPRRSAARGGDDPLVIAGGPVAFAPEPLAPFIDLFLVGDGEEELPAIMRQWSRLRDAGLSRRERLVRLARGGPGRYVPALYEVARDPRTGLLVVQPPADPELPFPVTRAHVADISRYPFPTDAPVAESHAIFDRHGIEIARGCTEGCRFCQAGMIYRPVRERSPDEIVAAVVAGVREAGYDEVSLTSLSTADYSAVAPLVRELVRRLEPERISLAVSSLRAYGLPEELLDDVEKVRATSLTFAPEAGTQAMRDVINKNVDEDQLLESVRRVFARKWDHVKLYFMIGLPSETDDDVRGIVETSARCQEVGLRMPERREQRRRPARVTCSVSSFVPKPHTPFQWAAMDDLPVVERKQTLLDDTARRLGVTVKYHDRFTSHVEGVLSRGDRRTADLIEWAYEHGCRFDGWDEHFRFDRWMEGIAAVGLRKEIYLGTVPVDARLPWDHIDPGVETAFLAREYQRALRGRVSPPCGKPAGATVHPESLAAARDGLAAKLVCHHCGIACDLQQMKERRLEAHRQLVARSDEAVVGSGGERIRLRLVYRKAGAAVRMTHHDLLRLWPRLLRRAGLPVVYTEGFHPHAKLSYTPALPMGMESDGEQVELMLRAPLPADEVVAALAPLLPEGMEIVGCHLGERLSMSRRLTALRMRVTFAPRPDAGFAAVADACRELLARESWVVVRDGKKPVKRLEVRPRLLSLRPLPAPAGGGGDTRWAVECTLGFGGGAPKAEELAAALGGDPSTCGARRLECVLEPDLEPQTVAAGAGGT
ncbi:MAG: TIGR03960 family B12-binding radical SAM protein [Candidatus Krumholzibacteriia bacterium]